MWILVALAALGFSAPSVALEIQGTQVSYEWTQGEGSTPEGWRVYVSRDGNPFTMEQEVSERLATIGGLPDQTVVVRVTAYLGDLESEASEDSESVTFRFLPAPGAIQITCPVEGETFTNITGDLWVCQ
jgi:hypothetical protein